MTGGSAAIATLEGLASGALDADPADVGANCDFWCLFGSLGAGAGMGFGFGSGFGSGGHRRRESGRDWEGWKEAWKDYKESGGHGPPPGPPPYVGPGPSDVDWMMKFYKAYKWAQDHVGGPEVGSPTAAGGKA